VTVFLPAVRAEWTKARTVRSTWWSLVVSAVSSVGIAALLGRQLAGRADRMAGHPAELGFYSLLIGQIALVVFGVLVVSTEYTTSTVRASLAAVPRRGVFLAAKAVTATGIALVTSVVIAFGAFLAAQWGLGEHGVTLGDTGVLPAVLGACAYLTSMCVFAMAVATTLRSTSLSLGIMIPVLFLNSQGLANLPAIRPVTQFLPDQAGAVLMTVGDGILGRRDFGPGGALPILLAWVAVAVAGAYVSVRRRDA
jgi:ABC-2 type transport system permease protein